MLYGYSEVILKGILVTLELALSSVLLAAVLGLIGAGAKLSRSRPLAMLFEGYTTLIRGARPGADAADFLRPADRPERAD